MNRKDFFKKIGLGALVALTAPKLLAKEGRDYLLYNNRLYPFKVKDGYLSATITPDWDNRTYKDAQLIADEDIKMGMWVPYKGNMTPLEILKIRKETGLLIYQSTPYDIIQQVTISKP